MQLIPPPAGTASFTAPRRTLMGPGPSDVHPRVLAAMAQPTVGHLDPAFNAMMDETKALLRYVFQTQNDLTFPISAPGSTGMETCFVNLIEPGDTVIVCVNGVFGGRMIENAERAGGTVVRIDDAWGAPVSPDKVREAFKAHPHAVALAFVHAETSTGACSDAATLCGIAREFGALTIVDAVTSLVGVPLLVDAWGIDAIYSGSQKCLGCPPGLSPASFSSRALNKVRARKSKSNSWFMDLSLVLGYWNAANRTYHHTAPTNGLVGLHESLVMAAEEGLEASWARHQYHHQALRDGLQALGFAYLVAPEARLPQLNSVHVPAGLDEGALRRTLMDEFNLEIGAGLGPLAGKILRFGLMGYSAREENVRLCLRALEAVLPRLGHAVDKGAALRAAESAWALQQPVAAVA